MGECIFLPLVEIRENPEFHDLMRMDKGRWPRCLQWHGWLPFLSGTRLPFEWDMPPLPREGEGGSDVPDVPNAWTDGSLVQDQVSGASSSGSVFFFLLICLVCIGTTAGGVNSMRSGLMMGRFG